MMEAPSSPSRSRKYAASSPFRCWREGVIWRPECTNNLSHERADQRVRVDAERIGQGPTNAAACFDRIEDRHVTRIRNALETVILGNRHLLRAERAPGVRGTQPSVHEREVFNETPTGQLFHRAGQGRDLRSIRHRVD